MICPYCGHHDSKVIDSRSSESGRVIRRRRQCLKCDKRFTTYERVEQSARLMVIKRDGSRVPFNRENILRGIQAACGKRNIAEDVKERLADTVEEELHRDFDREVESVAIGARVMAKLRDLDEVAYIRFASEYLKLGNAGELEAELASLRSRPRNVKQQQSLF
ncbi:MAG: transcriptional regulator NrdR [Phycisphaerales bacterium]